MKSNIANAWNALIHNKKYLLLTILLEIIFLFGLVQLHFVFFTPTLEVTNKMMSAMSTTVSALADSEVYQLETRLQENTEFMTAYHELLKYLAYFLLSVLAIWMLFRGPVWWLSHKMIYKKMSFTNTWLKFSLLSIFWFAILIASFFIYSIVQGTTFNTALTIIMAAVCLAILYFGQISFALMPAQQTFKSTFVYGARYARTILPAFAVNLIITGIAVLLPFTCIKTIPLLSVAIIILITIPGLAFARLHIIIATWQKH
ncbi:Uncharacterised protein [uncultured archaeon]|nr:Uncharacterised protein [uncultured archaeon]